MTAPDRRRDRPRVFVVREPVRNGLRVAALVLVLGALAALAGCTGVTTQRLALRPAPDECEVHEVRPSWFSTLTLGVCYDSEARPLGLASGTGRAVVDVPLEVLGAGATLGGAAILANGLRGAAAALPRELEVDGEGRVDVVIDAAADVTGDLTVRAP